MQTKTQDYAAALLIPTPILFLAFANDRDDRARYLRNLAGETRQALARLVVDS